ncbi:hypothetical protein PMAG_a3214 [Pseudoalteromonas mariniglutinosa NCIMB 1770]|nr:hypothetical protein [Pseudoalteromonas mariniglutinosa NCIMB 1770]
MNANDAMSFFTDFSFLSNTEEHCKVFIWQINDKEQLIYELLL